jgi:hypothetical protein
MEESERILWFISHIDVVDQFGRGLLHRVPVDFRYIPYERVEKMMSLIKDDDHLDFNAWAFDGQTLHHC